MYSRPSIVDEALLASLPRPSGYRLLVAMPEVKETTAGGVYIPENTKSAEEVASIVGVVLAMGPDAYTDMDKFPSGPWCKPGDSVVFRSYSGTRFKHAFGGTKREYRLINDDTVEAVVVSPEGFSRS